MGDTRRETIADKVLREIREKKHGAKTESTHALKSSIEKEQAEVDKLCMGLGMLFIKHNIHATTPDMEELVKAIREHQRNIQRNQSKLNKAFNLNRCKVCGESIHPKDKYCSRCGAPIQSNPQEAVGNIEICPICNFKVGPNMKFCTQCGYQMYKNMPDTDITGEVLLDKD